MGRRWESDELAAARECEGPADFARVARELGRTPGAVKRMRYFQRPAGVCRRTWTPAEDAMLRALPPGLAPYGAIVDIARKLGRTVPSVSARRLTLLGRPYRQ